MVDDAGVGERLPSPRLTYLLVDGENIDATLGNALLLRRPEPDERPRWERVLSYVTRLWGQEVRPLFFLNVSSRDMPLSFVQALVAMQYRPIPLTGGPGQKVVDLGIQRTLEAIKPRAGDVVLASHDGDFHEQIVQLLGGDRRVALLGFREFFNSRYAALVDAGLGLLDLEGDADAFMTTLPRVRAIDIDEFDPTLYL